MRQDLVEPRRAIPGAVSGEPEHDREQDHPDAHLDLRHRGLRVSELATRHRLANNTVSNLIQQMVLAGLVERREDPRDRRAVTLDITPNGAEQLRGWLAVNDRRLYSALHNLPAQDRRAILAALPSLSRLVDRLERSDEQSLPGGLQADGQVSA